MNNILNVEHESENEENTRCETAAAGTATWRREQRRRLLALRCATTQAQRQDWNRTIEAALKTVLPDVPETVFGMYWPFRAEFAIRPLMRELHKRGGHPALPRVVKRHTPLEFRHWFPGVTMRAGAHGIPEPVTTAVATPSVLIIPLVGFDDAGFRLGYGGGYYDRTIGALRERPLLIGVGYELSRLSSIHPQTHDIPMNYIVTEAGVSNCR